MNEKVIQKVEVAAAKLFRTVQNNFPGHTQYLNTTYYLIASIIKKLMEIKSNKTVKNTF